MNIIADLITIMSSRKLKIGTANQEIVEAVLETSAGKAATAKVYGTPGVVTRPAKTTKGIRLRIGNFSFIISAFNYRVTAPENEGETKIFSTDKEGVEQSSHVLTSDGKHVLNNGEDFVVAFTELQSIMDSVAAALNAEFAEIATAISSLGGSYTPGTISINITDAKVEEVMVP